ncbi:MAG TPA: hypothetical protein VF579_01440, partial [Candidatus Methylomirabilis sp.]
MFYPQVGHYVPGLRRRCHPAAAAHRRGRETAGSCHSPDERVEIQMAASAPHARPRLLFRLTPYRLYEGA